MFASYLPSRTVSPAYCVDFLRPHAPGEGFWLFRKFAGGFDRVPRGYVRELHGAIRRRWLVMGGSLALLGASLLLYLRLGQELFPITDAGQFLVNVRAQSGTRIEKTEELVKRVEAAFNRGVPAEDRRMIVSDIGVLYDWPAGYARTPARWTLRSSSCSPRRSTAARRARLMPRRSARCPPRSSAAGVRRMRRAAPAAASAVRRWPPGRGGRGSAGRVAKLFNSRTALVRHP